jgi:uncharacterized MnhB-related membrane protein
MVVIASTIDGNHRYNWRKNRRSLFVNYNQLTSQRGILSLKSADRSERRNQQPQKEEERRDHRGRRYVILSSHQWTRFSARTTLRAIPGVLAEAMQTTLALMPSSEGQKTAQREIATALETALDARRQRIIISQSQVNLLKWSILFMQAVCALVAIAMVHSDNRLASIIALGIFATGVAASMLLILAHDRPFTGEISIRPDALLQVMPEIGMVKNGAIPFAVMTGVLKCPLWM